MLVRVASLILSLALAESPGSSVSKDHVKAELVPEVSSIAPGKPFAVALRLQMEPGWHTYWENPGDSGLPTQLRWTLPAEFKGDRLRFPVPERFETPPLSSFGYSKEVWLLTQVEPSAHLKAGETVKIAGRADWLECREVCIPGRAEVGFSLPVGTGGLDPKQRKAFDDARERMPLATAPAGMEFRARQVGSATRLELDLRGGATLPDSKGVDFFPGKGAGLSAARAIPVAESKDRVVLELAAAKRKTGEPRTELHGLVLLGDGRAPFSIVTPIEGAVVAPMPRAPERSFGKVLLFALIGGLILNLMPCVFPVLSIKILSFVSQARQSRLALFGHGLVFTGGVLVSFWLLAGVLFALRASGESLGWGFQLQSPIFVSSLALLFFLLALNLLGLFEMGMGLMGWAGGLGASQGHWGSFLTGVLATVVATPCTAPFLGTALGFAFSEPPLQGLTIFTAIGIGMSLPYLVLCLSPGLLAILPKPGPWMERLKQFLAFPLLATVIWLSWVLGLQEGVGAVAALYGCLLWIGLGVWVGRSFPGRGGKIMAGAFVLLAFGLAIHLGYSEQLTPGPDRGTTSEQEPGTGLNWQAYSEAGVEALIHAGRVVFIDFTAAWCVTCQVNERGVLTAQSVLSKFKELEVAAVRADWTSRDPEVTRALEKIGRSGVPAYVVYGPGTSGAPLVLPELLTPSGIIEALDKARGQH